MTELEARELFLPPSSHTGLADGKSGPRFSSNKPVATKCHCGRKLVLIEAKDKDFSQFADLCQELRLGAHTPAGQAVMGMSTACSGLHATKRSCTSTGYISECAMPRGGTGKGAQDARNAAGGAEHQPGCSTL